MSKFAPSTFQQAIFDWIETGTGHAVVEAVAGSGKTTTAVEAINRIPRGKSILFLAFNKAIAEELQQRVPGHCDARTLNSLGHRAWMRTAGKVRLDADKTRGIMTEILSERELKRFGPQVRRLVGLAKSHGIVPEKYEDGVGLVPDTDDTWERLIAHFDVDITPCLDQPVGDESLDDARARGFRELLGHVRRVLLIGLDRPNVIDFDDQLYLPVVHKISPPKYDWVFVDEAQDLSSIQHQLVKTAVAKGGRLVAIGDSRQAIYGFRGADSQSMARFREELGATSLPLSICYRCPSSHVALAKAIVPQIEAAPNAVPGDVLQLGKDRWRADTFVNTDLIICRASAPLVRVAYMLLAQKVPVRIMGRDLGTGLVTLIKRLRPFDLNDLRAKIERWREREIDKLLRKDPEASTDKVDDKADTVLVFTDIFPSTTPDGLCREIETIYSDNTRGILTLATVHKAKGLEAERVFVLNQWMLGPREKHKPWQAEQELNLRYVALTRAKSVLGFIDVDKRGSGRGAIRSGRPVDANGDPFNYVPTPGSEAERLLDEARDAAAFPDDRDDVP